MLVYFSLLAFYAILDMFFSLKNNNLEFSSTNKTYRILLMMGLSLVMGLRSVNVGIDTIQYQNRYFNYEWMMDASYYQSEFAFNYINYFFNNIGVGWQLYLLVMSAIIAYSIIRFFADYSKDLYCSFFIFITIGMFTMSLSGLRQTLAVCICLLSFRILSDDTYLNKIFRYTLGIALIFLASSIHNSAVIFLILIPIIKMRLQLTRKQAAVFILIVSLSLFYKDILIPFVEFFSPQRYESFSLNSNYGINPLLIIIAILIPSFCLLINGDVDSLTKKYDYITSMLFVMSILNILFTILSVNNDQIGRLTYYFVNANAILIPNALNQLNLRNRIILKMVIVVVCVGYFYMATNGGTLHIDNYDFFWNGEG